jgi:hypothetical protein
MGSVHDLRSEGAKNFRFGIQRYLQKSKAYKRRTLRNEETAQHREYLDDVNDRGNLPESIWE